jgi:hypothetical protein
MLKSENMFKNIFLNKIKGLNLRQERRKKDGVPPSVSSTKG